ncbi:MAG TPA: 4-hydroxythreonine-4-phosphate dehydrogenase PdxA [Nitrospiria bacterium]|jgi:4-hydroxythreonine-4-phosphate dehydrogenase|nr:4-hydroxythreonine-4-phosphate dehydrogenase PdxA [Nitrospiria bacterium]
MKPVIAITMGDPAGIGPEIIVKTLSKPLVNRIERIARPVVVGDRGVLERVARRLKSSCKIRTLLDLESIPLPRKVLSVIDLNKMDLSAFAAGRPTAAGGQAAVEAIRQAVQLALARRVAGIVTAPISKEGLQAAGYPFPGHTELLAELCGAKEVGMLMVSPPRFKKDPGLRILLATTHVALRNLPDRLTRECVRTAIRLAHEAARRYFGLRRPRMAVAALNPHAGEGGLFGHEEAEIIRPVVEQARRQGIPVSGPFPADSLIRQAFDGKYDILVAMYHDQALIPIKLLGFGRAVNVTVGLPFVRTSPDHGTAYDIAGKGIADPGSLIEAIRLAVAFSKNTPSALGGRPPEQKPP